MKHPRRLVIDADIAHAAGGVDANNPFSETCHELLERVKSFKHSLVMTDAIAKEWSRHESRFANSWLVDMVGRRQVFDLGDVAEDEELRRWLKESRLQVRVVKVVLKDVHLIEAAIAAEHKIVISGDAEAGKGFNTVASDARSTGSAVARLRQVAWINARSRKEHLFAWLDQGAKNEKRHHLGRLSFE